MSEDIETFEGGFDQDWVYCIYQCLKGKRIDAISAADSREKLEHALEHWSVKQDDRDCIVRWLVSKRPKAKYDEAFEFRKPPLRRSAIGRNQGALVNRCVIVLRRLPHFVFAPPSFPVR